jgi:hypothetical protein
MKKNNAPRILAFLNRGLSCASLLWTGGNILPYIFIEGQAHLHDDFKLKQLFSSSNTGAFGQCSWLELRIMAPACARAILRFSTMFAAAN